jgi:hypothetical protein
MPWLTMDNFNVEQIKDLLQKNEKIGIAVGKNPDIDQMAAALALYLSLSQSGKSVSIACPTEPLVEVSSLVGIDKVKSGLDGNASDLIVSFPDKGDIEKISYTREEGSINIIVKAGEQGLSFDEKDIAFKRNSGVPNVIFIIGTPRLSDLGKIFDAEMLKDTMIVNIDNKSDNQGFGDVVLVSNDFSSVSESVTALLSSLGLKTDLDISSNLMSGISHATNNFQDPKTSPLAFEMASVLIRQGAKRSTPRETRKEEQGFQAESSFFMSKKPKQDLIRPKPTQAWQKPNLTGQKPRIADNKQEKTKGDENPPDDWLAPKIYKGSTTV